MTELEMAGRTHVGRVRNRNEDFWKQDPEHRVLAVADGMGGHPAGDVASRLAVETLLSAFENDGPPSLSGSDDTSSNGEDAGDWMAEAVRAAHRRILDEGRRDPERHGMGTTLTSLLVGSGSYLVGHVGDSRAYLLRDGSMSPLTRDHTPLQEEVDSGRLSREEARVHPLSHVLSQALGTTGEVEPEVVDGRLEPGDVFLLCTDGLTSTVPEARIAEIVRNAVSDDLDAVAERLVETTLEQGAPDNVTVALTRVEA